jgi:hypothetical protein
MNIVRQRIEDLRDSNYILNPDPHNNYWTNITFGPLNEYLAQHGEAFNIVIVGDAAVEGDFYAIPYAVLKPVLAEEYITRGRQVRWVVSIRNHQFKVRNCPVSIDVGAFYGNHGTLANPGQTAPVSAADANDDAIESRKIEIEQRLKQSVFRQRVIENFQGRCCLSEIREGELLVASHIIPWSKRIDTRLDPANGLLLYWPYDRLFDRGFISFDDNMRLVLSQNAAQCSPPLRAVLEPLAGRTARRPVKWPIKPEYLAYHRAEILKLGQPVCEVAGATLSEDAAGKGDI